MIEGPAAPPPGRVRDAEQQARLGRQMLAKGKTAQAIARFERAARLDPRVASTYRDLARAYGNAGRLEQAVAAYRQALKLDAGEAGAWMALAAALEALGRDDEARPAFAEGLRLDPTQAWASERLGALAWRRGDRREAEARYRAAAATARAAGSNRAELLEAHADLAAGRTDAAEARLARALAADPSSAEAQVSLGRLLGEAGRIDEAAAHLEAGLALDPRQVAAWGLLANMRTIEAAERPKIAAMEKVLQQPLTPPERMQLHFALGKALDDLGDYAAAWGHFDAANRIRGAQSRFDPERFAIETAQRMAETPRGFLDRDPPLGVDDETPVLIVGMPRSGTTLVEQILSSHPQVAPGGELRFWGDVGVRGGRILGPDAPPAAARRIAGEYLPLLRSISPDALRITDKMPFNFAFLGLIRQVYPRATIVHCRRDPIDTCLSIYTTHFAAPFAFASNLGHLAAYHRQYERLMAHWAEVLPAERLVKVDYEALVADPEPVTRRLVAACGLAWDEACLSPHLNRRRIETASLWQASRPIYKTAVGRWRRYEPWLGALRALEPAERGPTA